jgi:hypothetical protein
VLGYAKRSLHTAFLFCSWYLRNVRKHSPTDKVLFPNRHESVPRLSLTCCILHCRRRAHRHSARARTHARTHAVPKLIHHSPSTSPTALKPQPPGTQVVVKRFCSSLLLSRYHHHADVPTYKILEPYYRSVGKSTACHRGGPVLIPGQSLWDLLWTQRHLYRVFRFPPVNIVPPLVHISSAV